MSTAAVADRGSVRPVRGPGDGMETDKPPVAKEIAAVDTPLSAVPLLKVASPKHSPKMTHPATASLQHSPHSTPKQSPRASSRDAPSAPQPPGVLHLGKVPREACVVVEAVRIVVPRAAISRRGGHVGPAEEKGEAWAGQQIEEQARSPSPPLEDLRGAMEKLQNSERRLLQDKEGLLNQIHVQTEVNRELKKLLVASVGDDLQYHFERLAREKNQLILENEALGRSLSSTAEQLERMSIQCDVWRSKFLASRVMAEELTNARVSLQHQTREAQSAITDLLSEREEFSRDMMLTHRSLEQLLVSLQWGRQQTYYPSAQPLSTGELALANHKLADAINSHLLGEVGPAGGGSSGAGLGKGRQASELPNTSHTPAEKMAEKVLKILDPISCSDNQEETSPLSISDSSPSAFLTNKKSIGRFHPYTRYENITFNCCERCSGEILVL
ncbi:golgin-45 [Coregonus clupeaformis]|uniref:golgin-45 n=1 Tax=Coregonus clupeaformis TaxID=59861 RepID=UPI001E1C4815|nr:golgin-45 [Coregonus clupeaformis]XP_041701112.2 golgin-45 [Coregonus clupeaformis]